VLHDSELMMNLQDVLFPPAMRACKSSRQAVLLTFYAGTDTLKDW
jgi:hypothetical protein